jgi:hypothetical protein
MADRISEAALDRANKATSETSHIWKDSVTCVTIYVQLGTMRKLDKNTDDFRLLLSSDCSEVESEGMTI